MAQTLREKAEAALEEVRGKGKPKPQPTRQQSERKLDMPATSVFARELANNTFRNTVTNGAPTIGRLLASGGGLLRSLDNIGPGFWDEYDAAVEDEAGKFPAAKFIGWGGPDPIDAEANLVANLQTVGGVFGDVDQRKRDVANDLFSTELLREEQYPSAVKAGDIGADILTLIGLRGPGSTKRVAERAAKRRGGTVYTGGNARAQEEIEAMIQEAKKQFGQGAKKIGGTSAEAAFVSALNGNDPLRAAIAGASIQAGSSGMLFLGSQAWRRNIVKDVATMGLGLSLAKAIFGGDDDIRLLQDIETIINKNSDVIQGAMIATVLGTRRPSIGKMSRRAPVLAEGWNTGLRTGVLSQVTSQLAKAKMNGEEDVLRVVDILSKDPQAFGQVVGNRVIRSVEKGDLRKTVKSLLEKDSFQRRLALYGQ